MQSGKPKDAYLAAWEIRRCKYIVGVGATQKTLEKFHERGVRVSPKVLADTISPLESAERMCQELDEPMKAQYEPLLRKAMEGGESGAAALWWVAPEAKAFGEESGERLAALDLLRRDAKKCELGSYNAYRLAAARLHKKFDPNEVAAVYDVIDQLFRDKKLKNNSFEKGMKLFPMPNSGRPSNVDENIVAAMTVKILSYCD